jgi:pyridinium-3,5-bisthiocarboxylic acid mononucleotide nickel chelatase
MSHAWIDASAGVAGDMLLGAVLDAGAELASIQAAVDGVIPGSVRIGSSAVTRAGLRATKAEVETLVTDPPHRTWQTIAALLAESELDDAIAKQALAVFERLAEAEGRVHGIPAAEVHFHEVGALDAIADIVGVCAGLHQLGVDSVSAGPISVGAGQVRTEHGALPVPVPAVVELSRGWRVRAGGDRELATPTGVALVVTLSSVCEDLPPLELTGIGVGAGSRDVPGRANVTRLLLGRPEQLSYESTAAVVLEANVDDLDPRLWPDVLDRLLGAGADDAWLSPIVMKKGRPAHTLHVLCTADRSPELRALVTRLTSTLGVRQSPWAKYPLPRTWRTVTVDGQPVPVKLAYADGVILQVNAEFDAIADLAARTGRSQKEILQAAMAAAAAAGLIVGATLPSEADANT